MFLAPGTQAERQAGNKHKNKKVTQLEMDISLKANYSIKK
jgi:hypothetical protein